MDAFLGLCLFMVSTDLLANVPFINNEVSFFTEVESSCADTWYPQNTRMRYKKNCIAKNHLLKSQSAEMPIWFNNLFSSSSE